MADTATVILEQSETAEFYQFALQLFHFEEDLHQRNGETCNHNDTKYRSANVSDALSISHTGRFSLTATGRKGGVGLIEKLAD